ncbi:predicted protein [Plenodomus lingam JN3]|uniref:Predicted protein n=1 Tax=Leptosphaeria maculans (strain JN3 / isolate v23.1.3 / race Av1-4-5-6-7-8) TaxID=985895 RepID=E4ZVD6_LEPMJ|nr:predicted protein [Plenodomus lingam JN3]CBX95562.1 predicted protein [Plenodomus lingam JN3]
MTWRDSWALLIYPALLPTRDATCYRDGAGSRRNRRGWGEQKRTSVLRRPPHADIREKGQKCVHQKSVSHW